MVCGCVGTTGQVAFGDGGLVESAEDLGGGFGGNLVTGVQPQAEPRRTSNRLSEALGCDGVGIAASGSVVVALPNDLYRGALTLVPVVWQVTLIVDGYGSDRFTE